VRNVRTSRVSGSTHTISPSIRKPVVGSDLGFRSNMNQHPHQHLEQKKKNDSKRKNRPVKLSTNKSTLIVKGICLGGEVGAHIHNHLLHNAKAIQYYTKIKVRNNIYKTSI
jgi:hypothetical protein